MNDRDKQHAHTMKQFEPTPQEQKVAPPVDGQSKSAFTPSNGDTPAVVGLDLDLSPTPLQLECTRLQAENEEQARLLGISGSREAKLLAEIAVLRERIRELTAGDVMHEPNWSNCNEA